MNPATDGSLVFGDGAVASETGVATFEGFRPVGEMPVGEEQIAYGTGVLTNPLGAEYQATLRSHGPYDPDTYGDEQLITLDGGCMRVRSTTAPTTKHPGSEPSSEPGRRRRRPPSVLS